MSPPASILVYGRDQRLADTRALLLMREGYKLATIWETDEIGRIAAVERIDLLVLCHSLKVEDSARALAISRAKWPQVKILALVTGRSSQSIDADVFLYATEGPRKLLETVCRLVGGCNGRSTKTQNQGVDDGTV